MSSGVSTKQILQLYKNLLRYGQQLKLTDKKYYANRIRTEFKSNKTIENPEEVEFFYKRGLSLLEKRRLL